MHRPGTVEWLYSTNCAMLPFRWMDESCCPRRFRSADRDDHSSNVCFGVDPKIDGRSINLESMKYATGDGDDDTKCASFREASKDEDAKVNLPTKEAVSDCNSAEGPQDPQDQTRCCKVQEIAAVVSDSDESLDWQEERKQWISAAGVSTPSDLQRKIEDMGRSAAQNEADLKSLFCHVAEVKTFLLQVHGIDEYFVKRKRRCDRSSRRRKRSRRQCSGVDCCSAMSEYRDSSTESAPKQARESLLDPEIMRSFGSLIKSSA